MLKKPGQAPTEEPLGLSTDLTFRLSEILLDLFYVKASDSKTASMC